MARPAPEALAQVVRPLHEMFSPAEFPQMLAGLGTLEDAAVYRLDDQRALIVTANFLTPMVDDPYAFGAIAAANALTDVYAMGGEPLLAINLVAFPAELPQILAEVLRGGAEKVREAGVPLAGGHTIQDKEPKYGLAVVGVGHPDHLLRLGGASPDDVLILTKPLGTGVIATASKRGRVSAAHLAGAVRWMTTLNQATGRVAVQCGLRAATSITGSGLLGHAWKMAEASHVGMHVRLRDVPLMDGAAEYAMRHLFSGDSRCNRSSYRRHVEVSEGITEDEQMLLFDAQTSGGLLLAVPPHKLSELFVRLAAEQQSGWVIGQVIPEQRIEVSP